VQWRVNYSPDTLRSRGSGRFESVGDVKPGSTVIFREIGERREERGRVACDSGSGQLVPLARPAHAISFFLAKTQEANARFFEASRNRFLDRTFPACRPNRGRRRRHQHRVSRVRKHPRTRRNRIWRGWRDLRLAARQYVYTNISSTDFRQQLD